MVMLIAFRVLSQEQAVPFTLADRDRIIKSEVQIEELNKRIEQSNTYMGWMMALFAAITAVTIGFAIWDRRSMIRPFESKIKEIENNIDLKGTNVEKILSSLRELAKTDIKVAEILKNQNLL
jgi:hypothetical protein